MTVGEKLMKEALTQAERDLLMIWAKEKEDPYCARQRAWEEVARRTRRPSLRLGW